MRASPGEKVVSEQGLQDVLEKVEGAEEGGTAAEGQCAEVWCAGPWCLWVVVRESGWSKRSFVQRASCTSHVVWTSFCRQESSEKIA